jgi:hypothetical protein
MDAGFFKASLDIDTKITQSRKRTITDAGFLKAGVIQRRESRNRVIPHSRTEFLTYNSGRVTRICVFNTVKLGTSASSP